MDKYRAFMDESGDTGWKLDAPYLNGGSSRYLTLTMIVAHERDWHRPARVIKRFKEKIGRMRGVTILPSQEIKATDLKPDERSVFIDILNAEFGKESVFLRVFSKTVSKSHVVKPVFRKEPNSLYNYMTSFILEKIPDSNLSLITDARATSINLRLSFNEYLATEWAGRLDRDGDMNIEHKNSHDHDGIQCADILANIIWRKYEFDVDWEFDRIKKYITPATLFFPR